MRECAGCGEGIEERFRFCPWCAVPQRRKLVEFFVGRAGRALRVSRYLDEHEVRVSVWDERGVAQAAVSLGEDEAERVARFLAGTRDRASV